MNLRTILALSLTGAFVAAFPMLMFKAIPEPNKDLLTYMLGQLSGFVGGIVAYHFASTVGAEKKTEQLVESARREAPSGSPLPVEVTNHADQPVPVETRP